MQNRKLCHGRLLPAILGLTLASVVHGAVAHASFKLCNESPEPVSAAIAYPAGPGDWISQGWWRIAPGACKTVIGGRLTSRSYYIRAEADTAEITWGGDYRFCTEWRAFKLSQKGPRCQAGTDRFSDVEIKGFSEVDTRGAASYTQTLVCHDCRYWKGGDLHLSLPTIQTTTAMAGRRISIPLRGHLSARISNGALRATLRADADLGELQALLPRLIRDQVEGGDDCGDRVKLHRIDVGASGSKAVISIGGKYERWECVSWHQPEIHGFSVKYKKRSTKTKLLTQSGSGVLEVHPVVSNNVVSVAVRLRSVNADGLLGTLMRDGFLGPWIQAAIRDAIPRTITVSDLRALMPPELKPYRPRIERVEFRNLGGGRLGLRAHATVTVTSSQASALMHSLAP